jgi:hypothetical protein
LLVAVQADTPLTVVDQVAVAVRVDCLLDTLALLLERLILLL